MVLVLLLVPSAAFAKASFEGDDRVFVPLVVTEPVLPLLWPLSPHIVIRDSLGRIVHNISLKDFDPKSKIQASKKTRCFPKSIRTMGDVVEGYMNRLYSQLRIWYHRTVDTSMLWGVYHIIRPFQARIIEKHRRK